MTPAANFATSFSSVVETGGEFATSVNDLKVNLKATMYLKVNSTSQRCPNKIIKTFMIEDFFKLLQVSPTPVVHLELRISPRILQKKFNGPNGILRGLGETDL
jgi:hypothetical protein